MTNPQGGTFAVGRGIRAGVLVALAAATVLAAPRQARADAYKDDNLGFSMNAPGKWKQMPLATDERWRVCEFQNPRQFEDADSKTNSWTWHQPKLDVVIIPNTVGEERGGSVREDGNKVIISRDSPYHDLKEYMDKKTQEDGIGGYWFSKDGEETKIGTWKVLVYEITIDKFTSTHNNSPRKVYGWAFYAEDAIYGVIGDALIKFEDKVKPELDAVVRSFKIYPRKGTLPGAATTPGGDGDITITKDPKKEHLTDDELKKRRSDLFNQRLAKIKSSLADGWKIKESENFTAVTHCDDKFTKEVLDHAEALRSWLEETLGFVGNGYAGKIILRICADENERSAMYDSLGWSIDRCEVVTGQDKNGWMENKLGSLNSSVYGIWLRDKNRELSWSLPPWIASGLSSCIYQARSKGRKISDFKASTWDKVGIDTLRRADKLLQARAFFTMDWESMWQDYENHRQAEFFVRYLLVGSAQKNPKYKTKLADYIKNLAILLDEQQDTAPKDEKEPANEAEEAAQQRARQDEWRAKQAEVLKTLLDKTFPNWGEKEWAQFNTAYWNELG